MSDKGPHFQKAFYFSFLFLVLYIPFFVVQNLLTDIQKENGLDNLGFKLIAICYIFQMFFSASSAAISNSLGLKKTIVIGSLCSGALCLCMILSAWRAEQTPED